jgi:hypothetical protein
MRDAVGLIEQRDGELALVVAIFFEGLAVADRARVALAVDAARVFAARERCDVGAGGVAEPGGQGALG